MESLLKEIGINQYEIKAYLALLKSEPITAYKLSKFCGVPFGRIYDIMERLSLKGLVELEPGKPMKFKAVKPDIAIAALLRKKEKEWEKAKEGVNDIIKKLGKKESIEDPISIIKGKEIYYWNILDIIGKAKKENLSIAGCLSGEKETKGLVEATKKSIKKGVVHKMIVPLSDTNEKQAKEIMDLGVEVKDYPISGLRVNLIDEKLCLLTLVDESLPYNRATITIKSPVFCKGIKKMFNSLWEKAKTIK